MKINYQRLFDLAMKLAFGVLLGITALLVFTSTIRHDYGEYLREWALITSGQNPWVYADGNLTGNAYGPLFTLLAYIAAIHVDLPKLIFAFAWLGMVGYLYRQLDWSQPAFKRKVLFIAALLIFNPYFFLSIVYYGQFDILVAALCLAAVVARLRSRDTLAGVLLGAAVMLKIYPVVILPALVMEGWRWRKKVVIGFFSVVVLTLVLSYWKWGATIGEPFSFASERVSSGRSIFRFLRGTYSPIREVDWLSLPLLVSGWLVVLGVHIIKKVKPLPSSILFLFVALLFYKVGYSQYYAPLFFLLPLWFFTDKSVTKKHFLLKYGSIAALLYISASVFLYYVMTTGYWLDASVWERVEEVYGLPSFLLSVLAITVIMGNAIGPSRQTAGSDQPRR